MAALHPKSTQGTGDHNRRHVITVRSEAHPWTGLCLPTWRGKGWQKSWQAREETGGAGCEAGALCYHFSKICCFSAGQRLNLRRKARDPPKGESLRGEQCHGGRRTVGTMQKILLGCESGQRGHCEDKHSQGGEWAIARETTVTTCMSNLDF